MTNLIRAAVVGTSWWADGAHLPGLRARADVELVAVCGRNPERLAAMASKFNVPRTFTDYEQMLAEMKPEVVVVLTPNHTHAPMTLAALDAGAHVICEKPLALNTVEAQAMLDRAEQLGRRHMTFLTYRGMPGPRFLKQLLDSDYLGRLHHVQACYLHSSWLDPARAASWKTALAEGGSGVLGDLGAHVIDLLQWWFGPMVRVAGSLSTFIGERPGADGAMAKVETDDAAAFVAEFEGGGQATVQFSRVAPERHNYQRFELYGSAGTLVYEYDQPMAHVGKVSGARAGEGDVKEIAIPAELSDGFHGQNTFAKVYGALTDPFFASLRIASPTPSPNFADGLATQKVIEAVARSAARGSWESI
ncbi:MAG: Gfo/Idh/MocA family oxidoreductase [Chloroflexota bacterium]